MAEPRGPADPDKSAVNASPQPNALIGSDRHSGPYASFMPLDPRCRQVCVCVSFSTTLFSTCCWGFMSLLSFPLFPWLNSTQCSGQLSVCVCGYACLCVFMWPCVNVTPHCSLCAYMHIQHFSTENSTRNRLSSVTWVFFRKLFCLPKALGVISCTSPGQGLSN